VFIVIAFLKININDPDELASKLYLLSYKRGQYVGNILDETT
jgi:hypothetical protein